MKIIINLIVFLMIISKSFGLPKDRRVPVELLEYLKNFDNSNDTGFLKPPLLIPDPDASKFGSSEQTDNLKQESSENYEKTIYPISLISLQNIKQRDVPFKGYSDSDLKVQYYKTLQPPIADSQPNYFALKPRKFSKKFESTKKYTNHRYEDDVPVIGKSKLIEYPVTPSSESLSVPRTFPSSFRPSTLSKDSTLNTGEYVAAEDTRIEEKEEIPVTTSSLNSSGEQIQYQMHGFDGPQSYKFGYDTGKGDNRHFRREERDSDGNVHGEYGYMDRDGKLHMIKYTANPEAGFRIVEK